jgi:NodT family efflux transporter outer membrane factor (OMF) lipoprotein
LGWEEFFPEPRLKAYIRLAMVNNRDLRISGLNIEEAISQLGIKRAERLPQVEAGLTDEIRGGQNMNTTQSLSSEIMIPAYELDFFSKLKNAELSARESYLGTLESYDAYKVSLVSAVALAYISERLASEKLRLAESTIKSWEDALAFMESRVIQGQATMLELEQARGQVEYAQAELLNLRVELSRAKNLLELLSGSYGEEKLPDALHLSSWEPKGLGGPLSSEILLKRPDVRAAEHALIAAHYDIGVARAQFFPSISLTGALGFMSDQLTNLFIAKDSVWSLGPSLNIPIFKGGRNLRGLELALTAKDKLTLTYEKSIQDAFKEVADALIPLPDLKNLISAWKKYLETQRRVLELASSRYQNGAITYLEVLEAQRNVFEAERDLLEVRANFLVNAVNLYAALGGGVEAQGPEALPKPQQQ